MLFVTFLNLILLIQLISKLTSYCINLKIILTFKVKGIFFRIIHMEIFTILSYNMSNFKVWMSVLLNLRFEYPFINENLCLPRVQTFDIRITPRKSTYFRFLFRNTPAYIPHIYFSDRIIVVHSIAVWIHQ